MSDRDAKGRLLPGHHSPGPGRPKRETEGAILQAINDALSPAQITSAIRTALDIAIEQRSARGIIAVLELAAGYAIGKPVTRVERIENDPIAEAIADIRQAYIDAAQQAQVAQQYTVIDVVPS